MWTRKTLSACFKTYFNSYVIDFKIRFMKKTYYIAYDLYLDKNEVIHGSATMNCSGKPALRTWIEFIMLHNFGNAYAKNAIQILSCIEVKEDFIK